MKISAGKKRCDYNCRFFIYAFTVFFLLHLILIYKISPVTDFNIKHKEVVNLRIVTPDEFPQIRINIGERRMNEGRLDEALEQFEKAIASDPSSQTLS